MPDVRSAPYKYSDARRQQIRLATPGSGEVFTRRDFGALSIPRVSENPEWDHDHCEFCSAKFMVEDLPDALHQGYATKDDYRWICERCFADFRDMFEWKVIDELD